MARHAGITTDKRETRLRRTSTAVCAHMARSRTLARRCGHFQRQNMVLLLVFQEKQTNRPERHSCATVTVHKKVSLNYCIIWMAPRKYPIVRKQGEHRKRRGPLSEKYLRSDRQPESKQTAGSRTLGHFQFETLHISNHTACRFAEKTRSFRSLWAGRRCAASSRFTFFKGKTLRILPRKTGAFRAANTPHETRQPFRKEGEPKQEGRTTAAETAAEEERNAEASAVRRAGHRARLSAKSPS